MRSPDRRVRQRLSPATRTDAILAAATTAFGTESYDRVSVGAVATASGASQALVYRYFGHKAGLYTAVVGGQLERLAARQRDAVAALPPSSSARDRVRVTIQAALDHVAEARASWASPFFAAASEPESVQELRQRYRQALVDDLTAQLVDPGYRRARLAIVGFLGFLGAAAQQWVDEGCPDSDRAPLVESALGALEGSLGDWGSLRPAPRP